MNEKEVAKKKERRDGKEKRQSGPVRKQDEEKQMGRRRKIRQ